MSNINRITGRPRAIVISSNVGSINGFTPPELIDVPPNTTIVGHRGNEFPGTALPSESHIRLVEISSEYIGPTRTVSLRYFSVRLSTAPDFKALSYTWGPASRPNSIRGVYFTDNLLSALVNIASTCEPQLFWIDALCINQVDLDEKPAQIRMMREIYRKAEEVFVWLGDPDKVSFELMRKICTPKAAQLLVASGMEYTDEELTRLGLPEFGDPAWSSLLHFLKRPYFRRVWVLQELVMARSTTVACGRYRFSWPLIQEAANWLREKDLMAILISQTFETTQNKTEIPTADLINITLELEDRRESLYLEELLGASRYLLATDPRDKIIGLLGLVTPDDPCQREITIDYRQPVADFYRAVTGTVINTHRSLKLLSLVTDRSTSKIEGLPSWVPDYSLNVDKSSYRWAHFKKSGNRIAVDWQPDTNELHIMGRIADDVVFVAEETASYGTDAENTLIAWFRAAAAHKGADEWLWILSLAAPTATSAVDKDAEAFWRTMLLDGVNAISPAPADYRTHFAAIVFAAYLQAKGDDTEWFLSLANAVLWALRSVLMADPPAARDDVIDTLIDMAVTARDHGCDFKLPDWVVPEAWVTLDDEGKHSLGPRGEGIAFLAVVAQWGGRKFFVTRDGRMGKGPGQMRGGERVLIVEGCEQVFLVREVEGGRVVLVGECYVHGLMRGEEKGDAEGFGKIVIV